MVLGPSVAEASTAGDGCMAVWLYGCITVWLYDGRVQVGMYGGRGEGGGAKWFPSNFDLVLKEG